MDVNRITEQIIGAAIAAHRALRDCRSRLTRSVYVASCRSALSLSNAKNISRLNTRASGRTVAIASIWWWRTGGWTVGLLINFNAPVLKEGVKRIVDNLVENSAFSAPPR
jgi:hypothetical protein